jgi:hypothetical protein
MKLRSFLAALALAGAVACSDNNAPTAPTNAAPPSEKPTKTVTGPITQTITNLLVTDPISGATALFSGTLTINSLTTNSAGDLIIQVGTLTGNLVGALAGGTMAVNESLAGLVLATDPRHCTILHLDLGPIFLDLLGLQVTTNEIVLDITAVAGPGNLLGNLLCSLVHLLDQNPLSTLVGQLLAQINAILAGL